VGSLCHTAQRPVGAVLVSEAGDVELEGLRQGKELSWFWLKQKPIFY